MQFIQTTPGKENEEAFTASFKETNKTLILKLDKGCINMYVWLGPFTIHLKLPQHCLLISYTQYKIKSFF